MWFGLLFSILGIGSHFFTVSGEVVPGMPVHFTSAQQMTGHFLDRTAQCLVEVNYLRPCRHTLETLCFYYALETFHARMAEFSSYVVLGIMIRVAMRLVVANRLAVSPTSVAANLPAVAKRPAAAKPNAAPR